MKRYIYQQSRVLKALASAFPLVSALSVTFLEGSGRVFATAPTIEEFCRQTGGNKTQVALCIAKAERAAKRSLVNTFPPSSQVAPASLAPPIVPLAPLRPFVTRDYVDARGDTWSIPSDAEPVLDHDFDTSGQLSPIIAFESPESGVLRKHDRSPLLIPVSREIHHDEDGSRYLLFKDDSGVHIKDTRGIPLRRELHQGGHGFLFYENGDDIVITRPNGSIQDVMSKAEARRQGLILEEEQEHEEEFDDEEGDGANLV